MRLFRRILFYLFFTLYLVLCPAIIFYALGYIFVPKADEGFVKTGLIHIETLPANASLTIADRRYTEKTPATIRNLLAGPYKLKVSFPGYRPWAKDVLVAPGKANNFEKVLLLPVNLKTRIVVPQTFETLMPLPETRFLLLRGSEMAGDLKAFDWRGGALRSIVPPGSPLASSRILRIFTAKESSFILLQVRAPSGVKFWGVPVDKEKPEVKDLSSLFLQGEPREVLWEGGRPDFLFALYDKSLERLDLDEMTASKKTLAQVRGMGLFRGKIYELSGSSIVRENFGTKPSEGTLIEKGLFLENLFRENGKFKMDFISGNTLCFHGDQGELFSNVLPYRFVEKGVRGYQPDSDGQKIVLWQMARLGILDFEKPGRKKEFFERGPEIEWIFEAGLDLRQAYFVYEASHVLFLDGDQVSLARIGEGEPLVEKLVKVRRKSGIFYAEKTGKLYYLEPLHGELAVADILPEGISFSGVISELEKDNLGEVK